MSYPARLKQCDVGAAPMWGWVVLALATLRMLAPSPSGAADSPSPPSVLSEELPILTLHDLLLRAEDHLVDVRRVDLRREEAQAELDHLRASRLLQVEVEGNYREEDLDRTEINGDNLKKGNQQDVRRQLTFSITHPILGQSVEDRLLMANQQVRLIELSESAALARREATVELIGAYVDLAAEQRYEPLHERAVELATTKVRILESRHARGEVLKRDVLAGRVGLSTRRAARIESARRQVELMGDLTRMVDLESVAAFRASELGWSNMLPAAAGVPRTAAEPPVAAPSGGVRSSVWYNLPQLDLRFFYSMGSRDRTFADEVDEEKGHIPGVELTLEFPLDLWRSSKSYARQIEARQERQRLALLTLQRETAGRARAAALRHEEAAARLAVAEADLALQEEDHRLSRLRSAEAAPGGDDRGDIAVIDAELAVIDARAEVARAQGELARAYFDRAMIEGVDPIELAANVSPGSVTERTAEADLGPEPPPGSSSN